jgi:hypothetical protein
MSLLDHLVGGRERRWQHLEVVKERMEDEGYFVALIRMYDRALTFASKLAPDVRTDHVKRLDKLRPRSGCVAWGVEGNLNDLWYDADLDNQVSE